MKEELNVGDFIVSDSIHNDRVTGQVRQVVKIGGQRVYLDKPLTYSRSDYILKKTIVGYFPTQEQAQAVVDFDKEYSEKIQSLKREQKSELVKLMDKLHQSNQQLNK